MKREKKERSLGSLLGRGRGGVWLRRNIEVLVFEAGFGETVRILQADMGEGAHSRQQL